MIGSQHRQAIPTKLSLEQFEQFVLATSEPRQAWTRSNACVAHDFQLHPALLYTGCQWKALPIKMNAKGCPEIHYTRIYRALRRWQADGCIDRIFAGSVRKLHVDGRLDLSVIHGDGTTTAAKKGGDNLGYSAHKHLKGDKVVAFCDRDCNIISQFIAAAGNRNKSSLLRDALPKLSENARAIGIDLRGSTLSLVGVYGWQKKRLEES